MAETPHNNNGEIPCILVYCENPNITSCPLTCLPTVDPYLLPPPHLPPPPPPPPPSSSHIAPFLIAIVCVLGISFLLLTTCTIIFRYRFTRRRHGNSPTISNNNNNHDHDDDDDDHSFVDHPIWYITTVGLQQSVIDSITAFKYKKIDGFFVEGSSDSSCSVCLTEFEDGDDLRMLPKCCHPFHVTCIDTWLRSHKNCPLCRAPVVNEVVLPEDDHVVVNSSGGGSGFGGESQRMNLDYGNGGEGSSSSCSRGDDLTRLPVLEGIKIAEILRRNRELRIFSDLGDHRRFRGVEMVDHGVDSVRRSVSFNGMAKSGATNGGGSRDGRFGEGCSREGNCGGVSQQKNIDLEKGSKNKRGSSMSGLLIKSSSIGRSLQKGPVSMKRSLSSSSSRFFSFRRSKSQASVLPL